MLFALLFLASLASGASIVGITYDANLEPSTAILEVNTTPVQTMVAKSGRYSFNVPNGSYRILAISRENYTAEQFIEVKENGSYNIDLILFARDEDVVREFREVSQALAGNGIAAEETPQNQNNTPTLIALGLLIAFVVAIIVSRFMIKQLRAPPTETTTAKKLVTIQKFLQHAGITKDQHRVLSEIQKSNGRITQKELRKALSDWSEAKVSMEVTELEEKGVITKLKKGRGNVLRAK